MLHKELLCNNVGYRDNLQVITEVGVPSYSGALRGSWGKEGKLNLLPQEQGVY